jgi:hypothetical protein
MEVGWDPGLVEAGGVEDVLVAEPVDAANADIGRRES